MDEQHEGHGHSHGAWTGVGLMLLGTLFACWAVVFGPGWLFWAGLGVAAVGALTWYFMERASASGSGDQVAQASTAERAAAKTETQRSAEAAPAPTQGERD